jgi:hypothetical protein
LADAFEMRYDSVESFCPHAPCDDASAKADPAEFAGIHVLW